MAVCRQVAWLLPAVLLAAVLAGPIFAQEQAPEQEAARPAEPKAAANGGFRVLAPGVMRTIPPDMQHEETYTRVDLPELLAKEPTLGERPGMRNMAKDVRLEHDVWGLEFSFKPLRFVTAEIPAGSSGGIARKTVWYMVYKVTNRGDKPVRFIPRFLLHAQQSRASDGDSGQYYPDRIMATAIAQIQQREDPNRRLLNTVEMTEKEIQPSTEEEDNSVWGVVTWRDIDPKTDRLSIYVQGLSNAYEIKVAEDGSWERYLRKTLQLNFWRPSDEFYAHEREIRFGIPGDVDYRWVYK
jgi:hypothetical protein